MVFFSFHPHHIFIVLACLTVSQNGFGIFIYLARPSQRPGNYYLLILANDAADGSWFYYPTFCSSHFIVPSEQQID